MEETSRHERNVFSYLSSKDGRILIYWNGRQVMTLKGDKARKLLAQLTDAESDQAQLLLAKVTGNFKRGNER